MGRRVFLHIGTMKSATSYLQALCELNIDRLAEAGLFWCPQDVRYEAVKDLVRRAPRDGRATGSWSGLAERIHRHAGDVLLSNEMLAALNSRQISRLVRAFPSADHHVVVTARDLARVLPSHWQTTIKNGRTWTWSEFASAVCSDEPMPDGAAESAHTWFWQRHDLAAITARWVQVVPAEQVTLVTVPAEPSDPEVVATRFVSVLGLDATGWEHPPTRNNASLGAHSVELMRRLNGSMAASGERDPDHRFRRALGGALAVDTSLEPPFALTQDQQDWVRRRAQRMVDELQGSPLSVRGDLADLLPMERAQPGAVDPGTATDAEMLVAAQRGMVNLVDTFADLRSGSDELRRQLRAKEAERQALEDRVSEQERTQRRSQQRGGPPTAASGSVRLLSRVGQLARRLTDTREVGGDEVAGRCRGEYGRAESRSPSGPHLAPQPAHQGEAMTTTPQEPLRDDDMESTTSASSPNPGSDADGTDGDATDTVDGDSGDADGTDGDGTDGDATDTVDGDSGDADGTDA
ncbi:MAG: hypothetical protein WKF54_12325 [Nocardioidaceae bacterium]